MQMSQLAPVQSTDILDREARWFERGVREAIYDRIYNPMHPQQKRGAMYGTFWHLGHNTVETSDCFQNHIQLLE